MYNNYLVLSAPSGGQATNASSGALIEGLAGPNQTRLPEIRRTPNCINDLVRGQGYPREMMELTGHESKIESLAKIVRFSKKLHVRRYRLATVITRHKYCSRVVFTFLKVQSPVICRVQIGWSGPMDLKFLSNKKES